MNPAEYSPFPAPESPPGRIVHVTRASDIRPQPVLWLWVNRLAIGTLNLIGGREGIGKSIFACWLAAAITRGRLPGVHEELPRAVIIAATEDSWAHTIVPRLIAHGADLTLVYRVDIEAGDAYTAALSLPPRPAGARSVDRRAPRGGDLVRSDPVSPRWRPRQP